MKLITTALLTNAFAFVTTVAFAQINVSSSSSTKGGAAIGAGPGGVDSSAGRSGTDIGVDASGNSQTKPRQNHTTGSGSANGGIKLGTK